MIASRIDQATLLDAAAKVGVKIELDATSGSRRRWRVKLLPDPPASAYTPGGRRRSGDVGDAKYQRESVGWSNAGRRVNAVCWHGFRDFFRAAFEVEPDAKFSTAIDTWDGSEDFEDRYRESGHRNIGAPIAPASMADACRCPDRGYAG